MPEVSFGLEAGLGGGTMVPIERGVVGLPEGEKRELEENHYYVAILDKDKRAIRIQRPFFNCVNIIKGIC